MYMTAEEHARAAWLRGDAHTIAALDQAESEHDDAIHTLTVQHEKRVEALQARIDELLQDGAAEVARREAEEAAAAKMIEHTRHLSDCLHAIAYMLTSTPQCRTRAGREALAYEVRGAARGAQCPRMSAHSAALLNRRQALHQFPATA